MSSHTKFKKVLGCRNEELEKLTGYTRQGLHFAFNKIDQGKKPTPQFLVCMNAAIERKMEEETEQHEKRMEELNKLKEELGGLR